MFNIKNIEVEMLKESPLNPIQLHFLQNMTKRTWDVIGTPNTVRIILFNTSRNKLILLKRFDPAVYLVSIPKEAKISIIDIAQYPEDLGVVLELCGSNIVDTSKDNPLKTAKKAVQETGYNVTSSLEFVSAYKSDVGPKCGTNYLFYCEVNDHMKISDSGQLGENLAKIVEMDILEIEEYVKKSVPEIRSTPCFLYAMLWFLNNKCQQNS